MASRCRTNHASDSRQGKNIRTNFTRESNKKHIIRAALESIAFQVQDLLGCVSKDIKKPIKTLYVDGGATDNNFLMQFQSEISNLELLKPKTLDPFVSSFEYKLFDWSIT